MSRLARTLVIALVLAVATLAAGCSSAPPSPRAPAAEATPGGSPFLATSLVTAAGTWAVAVMGGSAASHNNFWQMFVRPAGSSRWKLVTPPGVADNGGLVVGGSTQSLITGFRPSRYLTYTPLTVTGDGGRSWSPAGPLDAAVADVPDALAVAPGTGRLLALLTSGQVKLAGAPGYTNWTALTSQRGIAATPPGRRCALHGLTAAAFTPAGVPLLAGTCAHPGIVGIFAEQAGTWQAAGPSLPATVAHQTITVVRLTRAANQIVALLKAGNGPGASLLAAWSADGASPWALSPPLPLGSAPLSSASFGPTGQAAIVQNRNRAHAITGPGAAWQSLPALPPGTATLALGPAGSFDALAVHHAQLTIWRHSPGAGAWRSSQTMHLPIQYGSSG